MAAPDDKFFASLERNFTGIGCTMEAQTTVSNSTRCSPFISEYKKYTVSGVTFSFNVLVSSHRSGEDSAFERHTSRVTFDLPKQSSVAETSNGTSWAFGACIEIWHEKSFHIREHNGNWR